MAGTVWSVPPTVGDVLNDLMASRAWKGAKKWRRRAMGIAHTCRRIEETQRSGLGPTRARRKWATLGVDGLGIADSPPGPEHPVGFKPRLTVRMAARLQGFPDSWSITGGKTAAYKQIGNACPPPVAQVVGEAIQAVLRGNLGVPLGNNLPSSLRHTDGFRKKDIRRRV